MVPHLIESSSDVGSFGRLAQGGWRRLRYTAASGREIERDERVYQIAFAGDDTADHEDVNLILDVREGVSSIGMESMAVLQVEGVMRLKRVLLSACYHCEDPDPWCLCGRSF